jgi:hypothetical protein
LAGFGPTVGGSDAGGAREYPKIVAERVQSNATDCCQEYLRLTPNHDGTATLAVCRYETLASAEGFTDEQGEVNLPDEIAGKTVIGVEDEQILGGELVCCGVECIYGQDDISGAMEWVRVNGWMPTSCMLTQILRAAFVSAHLMESERGRAETSRRYRRPRLARVQD